ncbi:hypothetical protein ACJVDH_01135 [Pedobacter sp. AW1-32]|uniref:hypothetical protein n=1 Tax=Pedobacter sp. AW1-32 TaxID=3383026 RepID=UPI003FF054DD
MAQINFRSSRNKRNIPFIVELDKAVFVRYWEAESYLSAIIFEADEMHIQAN